MSHDSVMDQNLKTMASYGKEWLESWKSRTYRGANFAWTKERAKQFAEVSDEELIMDEYFLNGKNRLWSGLIDVLFDILEQDRERRINLVTVAGGFGSGKTAGIGGSLNWLNWYRFSCKYSEKSQIANPQQYYGLQPTAKVAFIALSQSLQKSKDITFSEMMPPFNSGFNRDYFPYNPRVKSRIEIPNNNTLVFPNTATEAANAGYSVYSYVMDEVSFLSLSDNSARARGAASGTYDQARAAFESAEGRRFSRFGNDGMGVLISSVNFDEDFLMKKIREFYTGITSSTNVYYKVLLPWKTQPKKFNFSDGWFYFDTKNYDIIVDPAKIAALDRYYSETPIEDVIFNEDLECQNDEVLDRLSKGKIVLTEEEIEEAKQSITNIINRR